LRKSTTKLVPIVTLSDVHVRLASRAGPVHILRGIDLTINTGDQVGLVGPSGAGKSTLMMILAGMEQASSGRVEVAGQPLHSMTPDGMADFRRDYLGIVFQSFHLVPSMTALENIALPLELAEDADAFVKAQHFLQEVGLGARGDHYPAQLSGGEQQRVALARALVSQPALLLADEPTGNLDQSTGKIIIDLLFSLTQKHGTTLFLITHDEALASRCQRVLHMHDGLIREQK
jgi:putative ABC transport system ATP-binding protein